MKKILSVFGASLVLAGALLVTSCDAELSDIKTDTIQTLATPSNLEATQSYGSVILSWDAVPNAASYKVVRYDTSDNTDKNGVIVNNATLYSSTTITVENGKTAKVYLIDNGNDGLLTNGTKYKYEVTALATAGTAYDTSTARTLYFKDGSAKAITVTAEVADTVDVASALSSGIEFAFNKSNRAVITIPTAPGLSYKYFLVGATYNSSTLNTTSKTTNAGRAFTSSGRYVTINPSVFEETYTVTSNIANYDSTYYVNETVVANEEYQLFLAVQAKNTEKYGTNWTIVNTGLVAETYASTSSLLTVTSHNIVPDGKSKFLFIIRDQLAFNDSPSNYTYALKSYKVDTDADLNLIVATTPTVNTSVTLSVIDTDASGSSGIVYGTEYTSDVIADGESYLFILERTRTSDSQISMKSVLVTGDDNSATATTSYSYKLAFEFDSTSTLTLNDAGTIYNSTVSFDYAIGNDYKIGKVYKAKGTSVTTKNKLSSAFEEVSVTKTKDTVNSDSTHEEGVMSYTTSITKTAYDAASYPTTESYYYVLVITDNDGNTGVVSTTGYEWTIE